MPAYEADFLVFWASIKTNGRRKGDKVEAQKVWAKKGRPASALLIAGWKRYRESCGDGFTMDAERWIRQDGWKKEWESAPGEPANPRCDFHRQPGTNNRVSFRPSPTCPECKHVTARKVERVGEPQRLVDYAAELEKFKTDRRKEHA